MSFPVSVSLLKPRFGKMASVFGVHLGASGASIAVFQEGKTEIVANDTGDRTTPAIVAFNGSEKCVGLAARQGLQRNSANTICHVKNIIGLAYDDPVVKRYIETHTCKIVPENEAIYFEITTNDSGKKLISPSEVLTLIFKKMLEIANSRCGESDSHNVVIPVPLYFNEKQIEIIRDAAENSNFNVLQMISEPSAVLLAYDIGQKDLSEECYCLVYRLGGTSLDLTIIHVQDGMYSTLSHLHNDKIGGDHFTDALVDFFADEFYRQFKLEVKESRRSLGKLVAAAETCKHVLSTMSTARCSVESLHEGVDFNSNITRARFDSLTNSLIVGCLQPLDDALQQCGLKIEDISKVTLSGGASKMPRLQQCITDYFPSATILNSISPDDVIALGAAKQAALIEKKCNLPLKVQIPVLSTGIYIKTLENNIIHHHCILPEKTLIPVSKQQTFRLHPESTSFLLEIIEGNGSSNGTIKDANPLGKVVMTELPNDAEILANFHLKRDGSLHVTCTEKHSCKTTGITFEPIAVTS